MTAIGHVTKNDNGSYKGQLRTRFHPRRHRHHPEPRQDRRDPSRLRVSRPRVSRSEPAGSAAAGIAAGLCEPCRWQRPNSARASSTPISGVPPARTTTACWPLIWNPADWKMIGPRGAARGVVLCPIWMERSATENGTLLG